MLSFCHVLCLLNKSRKFPGTDERLTYARTGALRDLLCVNYQCLHNHRPLNIAIPVMAISAVSSHLKVIVIGAGPAGLCMATALRLQGHNVTVLERRRDTQARGHALVIQPAAVRALEHLKGAHKAFSSISVDPGVLQWWSYKSADLKPIAVQLPTELKSSRAERRFQTDRASVQKVLHKLAVANGANFLFGKVVQGVEDDAKKSSLWTSDGEEYCADLIIAADGMPHDLRYYTRGIRQMD